MRRLPGVTPGGGRRPAEAVPPRPPSHPCGVPRAPRQPFQAPEQPRRGARLGVFSRPPLGSLLGLGGEKLP